MQQVSRKLLVAAVLAFGTLTAACDSTQVLPTTPPVTGVQSVIVTPTSATIPASTKLQFVASVVADASTSKTVTWTSSNTAVATVDATGLATATANAGITSIIATAGGVQSAATLTVTATTPVTPPTITITAINQFGVPAQLGNIQGQVDVSLNTTGGAGVDSLFLSTNCTTASTSAADVFVASEVTTSSSVGALTLSINTAQLSTVAATLNTPKFVNGSYCIKAKQVTNGVAAPTYATVTTPITLNNISFFKGISATFTATGTVASPSGGLADGTGSLTGLRFDQGDLALVIAYINYGQAGGANPTIPGVNPVTSAVVLLTGKQALAAATIASPAGMPQTFSVTFPSTGATAANITQYQTTASGGDTLKVGGLIDTQGAQQNVFIPQVFFNGANPNTPLHSYENILNLAYIVRIDNASPTVPTLTTPTTSTFAGFLADGTACAAANGLPCTNFISSIIPYLFSSSSTSNGDANLNFSTTVTYGWDTNDATYVPLVGGTSTVTATCSTTGWTMVADASSLLATGLPFTPSTYRLRRFESDKLGNVRCSDYPNPFGVDNQIPQIAIADGLGSLNQVIPINQVVSYSFVDSISGFIINHQVVENIQLNFAGAGTTTYSSGSFTVDPTTQAYYTVTAQSIDQAGNKSVASVRNFLYDTTVPTTNGIAIPQNLIGGTAVSFATGAADNVDLKGESSDLTYSALTAAYTDGSGYGIRLMVDTLNTSSALGFTPNYDVSIQKALSFSVVTTTGPGLPGFIKQIQPTGAGGAAPAALAGADSGEALGINVRAVDAARNVSNPATAAIPGINIGASAGFTSADFSTFNVINAVSNLNNNTSGTGTQIINAQASAILNTATPSAAPDPFTQVCFYYQQSANIAGLNGQPYIPIGAYVLAGCVSLPAITDVAGVSRTWTYSLSFDPSKSLGTSGPLKLIAIALKASGVGVVTPVNSNTTLIP